MSQNSFVCTDLNGFKYYYVTLTIRFNAVKSLNSLIRPIDRTLTEPNTPGQRGPEINGNKRVLYISQRLKTGALPSIRLVSYIQDIC